MKIGWETERKFLVRADALPPLPRGVRIEQAYLGFEPVVRVRVEDGERAVLTVKGRGLARRREVEVSIPQEAARVLMELRVPKTCLIVKTRHHVLYGGRIWEIDVFHGCLQGLVLAEVELSGRGECVDLPPWVAREVTDDPSFQNANLARTGRVPEGALQGA